MRTYLQLSIRKRWPLYLVIVTVLTLLAVGFLGAVKITEERDLIVKASLDKHWRYDYDILVLPKDGHSYSEFKQDYMPPNNSIMNHNGISMSDWETIKSIEGIQVAAPVVNLGYVYYNNLSLFYEPAPDTVYKITTQYDEFNGLNWVTGKPNIFWHFWERIAKSDQPREFNLNNYSERSNYLSSIIHGGTKFFYSDIMGEASIPGMNWQAIQIVGVDFDQETKLYNFSADGMETTLAPKLFEPTSSSNQFFERTNIPVLRLGKTVDEAKFNVLIEEYNVPNDVEELKRHSANLYSYLEREVPHRSIIEASVNPRDAAYKYESISLNIENGKRIRENRVTPQITSLSFGITSPIPFQSVTNTLDSKIPMFELASSTIGLGHYEPGLSGYIQFNSRGKYMPDDISPVFADSYERGGFIEIWNPMRPRIVQDGDGNTYTDKWLYPTWGGQSYFPQPPDFVTSIESAIALRPDVKKPLSSIRVVVEGVETRSEENLQKVQRIADEIRVKTGHNAEIMIGSSAAKVHVTLPTISGDQPMVLEESWQMTGFSWDVQRTMNRSSMILFTYLAIISFVFIYTIITHSLLKRSADFAILRSVGWKRKKIIRILLVEVLLISILPVIPFSIVNRSFAIGDGYQSIFLFLILFLITGISYYSGSRHSILQTPRQALNSEVKDSSAFRLLNIRSITGFAYNQMFRRPARFLLLALVIAMTSFMIFIILSTQQSLQNELHVSFVGETLNMQLSGLQNLYVAMGVILTTAVMLLLIYLNLSERQKEFHVLKAIGWKFKLVRTYLIIEAIGISAIGTIVGSTAALILLLQVPSFQITWWIGILVLAMPVLQQLIFTLFLVTMMNRKGTSMLKEA
ncbi:FtsX-like permease family protein [Sporosarcina highlanderae]|uniref:ABC transporter permease n=1 Tax=Sporosarcina highlanderae TaxID=3035916 RepID=A0ABT8JQS6_9BACL|nr:ABC transporter permease [Sporosarcina highlanderae]MDN4607503.1 ABC transporter permease [Sporosarcina highlanderae]